MQTPRIRATQIVAAAGLLAVVAAPAVVAGEAERPETSPPTEVVVLVEEIDHFVDGSSRLRTAEVFGEGPDGLYQPTRLDARAARTQLSVRNTRHWKDGQKIRYQISKFFKQQKYHKLMRKAAALLNRERGTSAVPRQAVGGTTFGTKEIEEFADPVDYYFQHFFNRNHNVIMTEDDQMFRFPPPDDGIIIDPGRIGTTRRVTRGSCQRQGNGFLCTFLNDEVDQLLRSDFFDRDELRVALQLAAMLRLALGYNNTLWTDDFVGRDRRYLTEENFEDTKSIVWRQSRERDKLFHPDRAQAAAGTAAAAAGAAGPKMIPRPDTVIDFGGELQPDRDFTDTQSHRPSLVMTNLVGPASATGPNKALTVTLFRLEKTFDDEGNLVKTKQIRIARLKGATENFVIDLEGTTLDGFDNPFLSDVGFAATAAADSAIEKIRDAIAEFGKPMVIEGQSWNRVLEGRIEVKGQLTPHPKLAAAAGGLAKIRQNYYFVNSDEEPPPF